VTLVATEKLDVPTPAAAAVAGPEILRPLWVDAAGAARLLGISRSQFLLRDKDGLVPAPKDFGTGRTRRCPRWLVAEVEAWSRFGALPRGRWEQIRDRVLRR
jgi:hypothetical protein